MSPRCLQEVSGGRRRALEIARNCGSGGASRAPREGVRSVVEKGLSRPSQARGKTVFPTAFAAENQRIFPRRRGTVPEAESGRSEDKQHGADDRERQAERDKQDRRAF